MTGPTDEEIFRTARAEAQAFRAARATRRVIEGRRPFRHGGGAAVLLVVRNGDQIELLPHAATPGRSPSTPPAHSRCATR